MVELWLDGTPTRLARANLYDPELAARGRGDGCYRFVFSLDADTAEGAAVAEVRLANTGVLIGQPIRLAEAKIAPERQIGEARWVSGLRISGWIAWNPRAEGRVRAFVDGQEVAQARAQYFSHVGEAAALHPVVADLCDAVPELWPACSQGLAALRCRSLSSPPPGTSAVFSAA